MGKIKKIDIYLEERILREADFIIERKATIRQTAKAFNLSKSTIHRDVSEILPKFNHSKSLEVSSVLEFNHQQRASRGGVATSKVYAKRRINKGK